MARHHVQLTIGCSTRPTADDLAFLGRLQAKALTRGKGLAELVVWLDVDATDVVDALAQARDIVGGPIQGDILGASVVAAEGARLPPGRLVRRRRLRGGAGGEPRGGPRDDDTHTARARGAAGSWPRPAGPSLAPS